MKIILPFVCLGFISITAAYAAERPVAEVLEYGIYSGTHEQSVANTNAPTGQVLMGGPVKLQKQTDVIPAKLKSKFGVRFVVHGQPEQGPVRFHLVYLFPEMKDPASGRKIERFEANVSAKPEDPNLQMLWDFTEPYELVAGEWTFQVFRGEAKILEKKFAVVKADAK
jgi:hypothetical protein